MSGTRGLGKQWVPLKLFLGKVEYNMATKRKAAKKKAPARKKAAKKAPAKKVSTSAISSKMTKGQIVASLADSTDLTKKQVGAVLDAYENLIARSIKKRGIGEALGLPVRTGLYRYPTAEPGVSYQRD